MKKVKLNYTKHGYSYVKCTKQDCLNWGGIAICDDCNKAIQDEVYLVFILGRAFCKECFEEWEKDTNTYKEDIMLQKERHINWYKAYGFDVIEE